MLLRKNAFVGKLDRPTNPTKPTDVHERVHEKITYQIASLCIKVIKRMIVYVVIQFPFIVILHLDVFYLFIHF